MNNKPTNDVTTCCTPAICLGPTGNFQETYNFLSLLSGMVIKRRKFDKLPIPDAVISWVAALAQTLAVPCNLVFAN
jgi:hypothetical protein